MLPESQAPSLINTAIGSGCVAMGQLLFATNDAIIKLSSMKESQLLIGRFGVQLLIAVSWWIFKKPESASNWYGDRPYITNIWVRGVLFTVNTVCLWYGVIRLPLGDAITIYYQSPVVIAVIAWAFLGERLPRSTPIICILATLGVLVIAKPHFISSLLNDHENEDIEPLNIDGLVAMFISLFAWSISAVLVRTLLLHSEFIGSLDFKDWDFDFVSLGIMVIIGLIGFIALSLNVIGFQYGDATKVAWMEYTAIIFSFIYQIFVFRDPLDRLEVIGCVLVGIACSLSVSEELILCFGKRRGSVRFI